ncbi:MAG: SRPBCC domain-containing protein [Clostridiaceae bacterium]|nr:SRPBCC domain-containing protein [Clostridiaceae bacterium]
MKELRTEIIINASKDKVWDVFTNFKQYPEWNPFIKYLIGEIAEGQKIQIYLTPPGAKGIEMKPTIIKLQKDNELSWIGHLLIPGLFDGEHIFELIDNGDDTTKFVQREKLSGILVPFLKNLID